MAVPAPETFNDLEAEEIDFDVFFEFYRCSTDEDDFEELVEYLDNQRW